MELDNFCMTKGGDVVPPPCTPLTTPPPEQVGDSWNAGKTITVIVAIIVGFCVLGTLVRLACHFYKKIFGSTTSSQDAETAATPSAPALEYYPELPTILDVD